MLRGSRTPTFRRNVSYLPSIVDKTFFHDLLTIEDEGSTCLRNVGFSYPMKQGDVPQEWNPYVATFFNLIFYVFFC